MDEDPVEDSPLADRPAADAPVDSASRASDAVARALAVVRSLGSRLAALAQRWWPGRGDAPAGGGADPDRDFGAAGLVAPAGDAETIIVFAEDDAFDVIELIEQAVSDDLILMVPPSTTALREPLAWPHLAAQVRRMGVRVRVVCQRRDVRIAAQHAGFPVASRLKREGRSLRLGEREFTLPDVDAGRWVRLGLLAAVPLVGIVVAWLIIPTAEITIVPQSDPITGSATVRINPIIDEPDALASVLPAHSIRRTITTIASTATTGTTEVGDTPAIVELEFTNAGFLPIPLPLGMVVNDENGVAFTLDSAQIVPPEGLLLAMATATRVGASGNVDAGTLRLLSDDAPDDLTVQNPSAASEGTDKEVAAVDVSDVDRVRLIAENVLRAVAERELRAASIEGDVFLAETISVAILGERPLGNPGDVAEVFLMEYEAVVSALVVRAADLGEYAAQALAAETTDGSVLVPGTATATLPAAERFFENGILQGTIAMTAREAQAIDSDALRGALTGASRDGARARIADRVPVAAPAVIEVTPGWWPKWRLPERAGRITITLAGEVATDREAATP